MPDFVLNMSSHKRDHSDDDETMEEVEETYVTPAPRGPKGKKSKVQPPSDVKAASGKKRNVDRKNKGFDDSDGSGGRFIDGCAEDDPEGVLATVAACGFRVSPKDTNPTARFPDGTPEATLLPGWQPPASPEAEPWSTVLGSPAAIGFQVQSSGQGPGPAAVFRPNTQASKAKQKRNASPATFSTLEAFEVKALPR